MMNPAVQRARARASLRAIHHVSPSASAAPPSPRATRRPVPSSDASSSRAASCGNASRHTPTPISAGALAENSSARARCAPERAGPFVPSAMSLILPPVSVPLLVEALQLLLYVGLHLLHHLAPHLL